MRTSLFFARFFDSSSSERSLSGCLCLHFVKLLLGLLLLLLESNIFLIEILKNHAIKNKRNLKHGEFITFASFLGAFIGFFFPPSRPDMLCLNWGCLRLFKTRKCEQKQFNFDEI
jgi:hypothetical protein